MASRKDYPAAEVFDDLPSAHAALEQDDGRTLFKSGDKYIVAGTETQSDALALTAHDVKSKKMRDADIIRVLMDMAKTEKEK